MFGFTQNHQVLLDEEENQREVENPSLLFVASKFAAFPILPAEKVTLPVFVSVFTPSSSVVDAIFQNDVGVGILTQAA